MTKTNGVAGTTARLFLTTALVLGASTIALAQSGQGGRQDKDDHALEQKKSFIFGRRTRLRLHRISLQ
jgi:hypothetical protein